VSPRTGHLSCSFSPATHWFRASDYLHIVYN